MERKRAVCTVCDIACQLQVEVEDDKVLRVLPPENPVTAGNYCLKGLSAHRLYALEERLRQPLRRVGERGEGRFEPVSWDEAMGEIAERLEVLIEKYGPETFAVSTSNWNTSVENGLGRRVMNLLGSPNWTSGVAMCMGNTAAVNKLTYGWFPWPDLINTDLVVLFGHNPRKHSWTPIYNLVRQAQAKGAKLIVLDPRVSGQAARADVHLQLRSGTDAAMCLGWLNVIIEEELYDKQFVRDWCVGFDDLKERAAEYPLSRVRELTGVAEEEIRLAARMYATARSATIPWSPTVDQQVSSTSIIRLQSILRAICGHLDVPGGELIYGFNEEMLSETFIELHEALSPQQRAKQLGYDEYPAYTHRAGELLAPHTKRVFGHEYANIVMGSYMANPTSLFRAMATDEPYPVRAFFSLGNNTLMSYPNQQQVKAALLRQELLVVHELFMTPTARLADFILPGDTWLERPHVHDSFGWRSWLIASEKAVDPPAGCRGVFDFWRDLGHRMGLGDHLPWASVEEMLDFRLQPLGISYREFCATHDMKIAAKEYRSYRRTGFGTPSGKVELRSSILEDLGFDPLPYHRELPEDPDHPFRVFVGVREDPYFQTGQRQLPSARRLSPLPAFFLHPEDADELGLAQGDWAEVSTRHGCIQGVIERRGDMSRRHVRVPHGWWFPELIDSDTDGAADRHNDGILVPDDRESLDYEQGTPQLKGFPGAVRRLERPPAHIARTGLRSSEEVTAQ
ncbi:dehydrogenase [Nocardioides sp. Root190]|uniref:molybdopterin-containing oxidoreductase family protein n=1 Tax=Nocardioides sp. Root190 TaxID=1736488 RepID=UPI0007011323|nr:molybdopterin-dependent oxidoreductase [Nocardioides sp. Root190]KRB72692.1 dehydrogenase [Nocardioides sp. Root190]